MISSRACIISPVSSHEILVPHPNHNAIASYPWSVNHRRRYKLAQSAFHSKPSARPLIDPHLPFFIEPNWVDQSAPTSTACGPLGQSCPRVSAQTCYTSSCGAVSASPCSLRRHRDKLLTHSEMVLHPKPRHNVLVLAVRGTCSFKDGQAVSLVRISPCVAATSSR